MFESLSERLSETLRGLSGKGRLSEENISAALRDVRLALLEADVALDVVKEFIDRVKVSALGLSVSSALNPGEAFIKVVHAELVHAPVRRLLAHLPHPCLEYSAAAVLVD